MISTEPVSRDYKEYSFKELVEEKNKLEHKIHEESVKCNGLDPCFGSLSTLQLSITVKTIQNLKQVFEELNKRS